jgi:hypothetical protein
MTERRSPTAVLREGPRALSDEQVREIEDSALEGVLRGFLPAYYTGFTATCRDESRHVQGGMRYLQDAVRKDPR